MLRRKSKKRVRAMANKKHNIVFDEEKHEYRLGKKTLISVTQLLKKHNLSTDFSGVDEGTLSAKAERGRMIHKELENYIKTGDVGFFAETEQFATWHANSKVFKLESEKIVHNDIVAGTLDVLVILADGDIFVGDFKTGSKIDKTSVRWQLSIYNYLAKANADKLYVFHFTADGMNIVEVKPIATAEIERLLDCERNGTKYEQVQLEVTENFAIALEEYERIIHDLESQKKHAETMREKYREQLIEQFVKHDVKVFDTGTMRITYVEPSSRKVIDTRRLEKDLPDVAEKYGKHIYVKPSLRVKFTDEKADIEE